MNDKTPEQLDDETYPAKDFHKKVFNFSKEELAELAPLEDVTKLVNTLMALGQIAQRAKDNYVGGQVLDRLGIKKSNDSKFSYDLPGNRIIVYEPRLWCSVCNVKRAEFKYQDKIYCKDDIEEIKNNLAQLVETPDPKTEEKVEKPKKKGKN